MGKGEQKDRERVSRNGEMMSREGTAGREERAIYNEMEGSKTKVGKRRDVKKRRVDMEIDYETQ